MHTRSMLEGFIKMIMGPLLLWSHYKAVKAGTGRTGPRHGIASLSKPRDPISALHAEEKQLSPDQTTGGRTLGCVPCWPADVEPDAKILLSNRAGLPMVGRGERAWSLDFSNDEEFLLDVRGVSWSAHALCCTGAELPCTPARLSPFSPS